MIKKLFFKSISVMGVMWSTFSGVLVAMYWYLSFYDVREDVMINFRLACISFAFLTLFLAVFFVLKVLKDDTLQWFIGSFVVGGLLSYILEIEKTETFILAHTLLSWYAVTAVYSNSLLAKYLFFRER